MVYVLKVLGVIAGAILFFLAGWTASAESNDLREGEGVTLAQAAAPEEVSASVSTTTSTSVGKNFDSLLGETQFSTSGYFSLMREDAYFWDASFSGVHYIAPRFGVGGSLSVGDSSYLAGRFYFTVGPVAEYFVPLSDRSHIFTQARFLFLGARDTVSTLRFGATLGYRYFASESIALSVQLDKTFDKANVGSESFRSDGVVLNYGLSLFF